MSMVLLIENILIGTAIVVIKAAIIVIALVTLINIIYKKVINDLF